MIALGKFFIVFLSLVATGAAKTNSTKNKVEIKHDPYPLQKLIDANKMVTSTVLMGSLGSILENFENPLQFANVTVTNSPIPHPFFYQPIFVATTKIPTLLEQLEKLENYRINFVNDSSSSFETIEVHATSSMGEQLNLTGAKAKSQNIGSIFAVNGYIVDPPMTLTDHITILQFGSSKLNNWDILEKFAIECKKVLGRSSDPLEFLGEASLISNEKSFGMVIKTANNCNPNLLKSKFRDVEFFWTNSLPGIHWIKKV